MNIIIFSVLAATDASARWRNLAPKVNFYNCRTRDYSRDSFFVSCGRYLLLIILLALLVGVLYSLHLLVQDYQALSAPRLLRFLFKRDISSQSYNKPSVRWKRILFHDPIECARYVYCDLGARAADSNVRRGFTYMLALEPQEADRPAWEIFKEAYQFGKSLKSYEFEKCRQKYFLCPFQASLLFDLIQYLIRNDLN